MCTAQRRLGLGLGLGFGFGLGLGLGLARTSLPARGGGDPRVGELRQPIERVVARLLEAARVDDVHAVGDGDRGLGDVRADHHLGEI